MDRSLSLSSPVSLSFNLCNAEKSPELFYVQTQAKICIKGDREEISLE